MAEGRGGYRKPPANVPPGGPGAASRRTDGAQPIRVPNVTDATDLQYGDRSRLEAAQSAQPIGKAQTPDFPRAVGSVTQQLRSGGGIPPELTRPTDRPGEPITDGMPIGPGAGPSMPDVPDEREEKLRYYVEKYNNPDARRLLRSYRLGPQEMNAPAPMAAPGPATPQEQTPTGPSLTDPLADEPEAVEEPMGG